MDTVQKTREEGNKTKKKVDDRKLESKKKIEQHLNSEATEAKISHRAESNFKLLEKRGN